MHKLYVSHKSEEYGMTEQKTTLAEKISDVIVKTKDKVAEVGSKIGLGKPSSSADTEKTDPNDLNKPHGKQDSDDQKQHLEEHLSQKCCNASSLSKKSNHESSENNGESKSELHKADEPSQHNLNPSQKTEGDSDKGRNPLIQTAAAIKDLVVGAGEKVGKKTSEYLKDTTTTLKRNAASHRAKKASQLTQDSQKLQEEAKHLYSEVFRDEIGSLKEKIELLFQEVKALEERIIHDTSLLDEPHNQERNVLDGRTRASEESEETSKKIKKEAHSQEDKRTEKEDVENAEKKKREKKRE